MGITSMGLKLKVRDGIRSQILGLLRSLVISSL